MSGESSKSFSQDIIGASESENASRIASRMAKETIELEISKEIVEQAVEDGFAAASGTVIYFCTLFLKLKIDRLQLQEHYQEL